MSVDGQVADNLPTVSYNFRLRDSTENVQLVVLRGGASSGLSVAPVEQRSDFDSVSSMADPEKSLVTELGILGVEIDRRIAASAKQLRDPVRDHRRRARRGRDQRRPAPAGRRHPQRQQPADRDARSRRGRSMRALKPGTPVTLQIQREGRLMYVTFTVD